MTDAETTVTYRNRQFFFILFYFCIIAELAHKPARAFRAKLNSQLELFQTGSRAIEPI
jgi:hypothetical protein